VRVVLDTNVVMSGLLFGGGPARILSAWADHRFTLVVSPSILDEYHRVGRELAKGQAALLDAIDSFLALVTVHAVAVNPPPLDPPVCEDASDDMFLAAAVAGTAACVVSGDKHLLRVTGWQELPVLTPRQFTDRFLATDST
jgi:putative PIN family toxin of toxin-antitoxin system